VLAQGNQCHLLHFLESSKLEKLMEEKKRSEDTMVDVQAPLKALLNMSPRSACFNDET
jgi:hypothetical protein